MSLDHRLTSAAVNGDAQAVERALEAGCDINAKGAEGMTALALASFWGHAEVVDLLLRHGANVGSTNNTSHWTPLHCAAFQGQGPIVLKLLNSKADPNVKDSEGRTSCDFGSAIDAIWPLFAAAGCTRTPKSELLAKKIITKTEKTPNRSTSLSSANRGMYQTRPGSAYVLATQEIHKHDRNDMRYHAAMSGDVLANETSHTTRAGIGQWRTA